MNQVFHSDSEPRPIFNQPLVACREDQSEYIAYHYRPMPSEQSAHYPQKSLTRLIDAHHLFLTENLHEVFPTAFQAPVGSFAHLLSLTHT